MPYQQQQQPPSTLFAFLDLIEQYIHPATGYALGAAFAVGGYVYGLEHNSGVPLVVYAGGGLIVGLVAVQIFKHLTAALLCAALMAVAGVGTYLLLINEGAIRRAHAAPATQAAPARTPQSILDVLGVR